jgi:hypothetical protein
VPKTHTPSLAGLPSTLRNAGYGLLAGLVVLLSAQWAIQGSLTGSTSSVTVSLRVLDYSDDIDPPYVEDLDPASGALLQPVGTTIAFSIKDYQNNDDVTAGSGVNLRTVSVRVQNDGTSNTYASGSSVFTLTGSIFNSAITIDPVADFAEGTWVIVSVDAEDLHDPANVMDTFTYSFRTVPASSAASSSVASSTAGAAAAASSAPGTAAQGGGRRSRSNELLRPGPLPGMFPDVPEDIWYWPAVRALLDRGVLDALQPRFRPADGTLRAEMAAILVRMKGLAPRFPGMGSFADVPANAWYFSVVEEAAAQGWIYGYANCYHTSHPCFAGPAVRITRAEAAAMLLRWTKKERLYLAPGFRDVSNAAWYAPVVAAAADHCILRGVGGMPVAEPDRFVTRAELAVMVLRAEQPLRYGRDCGK